MVTMGPLRPHSTTVSPTLSTPLMSTTSTVVPRPSIIFTSSTEQVTYGTYMMRFVMSSCVICVSSSSKSGMPSPVMAEVGTSEIVLFCDLFSKYNSAFSPCKVRRQQHKATTFSRAERQPRGLVRERRPCDATIQPRENS